MISQNDAKVSIQCFSLCYEEAKKVKGLEDYQQYNLAVEMAKTMIQKNEKYKIVEHAIRELCQSNFFDQFGHELSLALREINFPEPLEEIQVWNINSGSVEVSTKND